MNLMIRKAVLRLADAEIISYAIGDCALGPCIDCSQPVVFAPSGR